MEFKGIFVKVDKTPKTVLFVPLNKNYKIIGDPAIRRCRCMLSDRPKIVVDCWYQCLKCCVHGVFVLATEIASQSQSKLVKEDYILRT